MIPKLEGIIRRNPLYKNKADVYFRLAELHRERARYKHLVACQHHMRQVALHEQGKRQKPAQPTPDFSRAIGYYQKLLVEAPGYKRLDEALYDLGMSLLASGRTKDGVGHLDRLVKEHPGSPRIDNAQYALGEYHLRADLLHVAKTHYEQVRKASALWNLAQFGLARVYRNLHEFRKAVELAEAAAPDSAPVEIESWIVSGLVENGDLTAIESVYPHRAAEARFMAIRRTLVAGDLRKAAEHIAVLASSYPTSPYTDKAKQLGVSELLAEQAERDRRAERLRQDRIGVAERERERRAEEQRRMAPIWAAQEAEARKRSLENHLSSAPFPGNPLQNKLNFFVGAEHIVRRNRCIANLLKQNDHEGTKRELCGEMLPISVGLSRDELDELIKAYCLGRATLTSTIEECNVTPYRVPYKFCVQTVTTMCPWKQR